MNSTLNLSQILICKKKKKNSFKTCWRYVSFDPKPLGILLSLNWGLWIASLKYDCGCLVRSGPKTEFFLIASPRHAEIVSHLDIGFEIGGSVIFPTHGETYKFVYWMKFVYWTTESNFIIIMF